MEPVNIAKTDCDLKISRIPELIGKRRPLLFFMSCWWRFAKEVCNELHL